MAEQNKESIEKMETDCPAEEAAKDGDKPAEGEDATTEGEAKKPEEPKELEQDAPAEKRATIDTSALVFHTADTTLNVMAVSKGKLLMGLTDGGFQYLLAGARASVGMKAGRYMFEVKIVESLSLAEPQSNGGRAPQPRQLVRVGVSTAGSSLFLSDGPDNIGFDSEGYLVQDKTKKRVSQKFTRGQIIAVLVNLDAASPNANTISLFRDGERVSAPQPIPEHLHGKPLFPHITYKNVTLQVNFGTAVLKRLPFETRLLGAAAKQDVEVVAAPKLNDGKPEIVFPVALPDKGFFDWVDAFVERNPSYVELSERKINEWASKSGLWRPKSSGPTCNDAPGVKFGIPLMDDSSVRRVLDAIAPTQARNYIVPELKANLVSAERLEALKKFSALDFKKTAKVIMGEPDEEFKQNVQALLLADKQTAAEAKKKAAAQEQERKRLLLDKKKKAEEARKLKEMAQKKKLGKEVEEEPVDKEEDAKEDEEMKADAEQEAPVELTDEEKKLWHRKLDVPDVLEKTLSKTYASFSLPSKEEGFDEISYAWQPEAAVSELFRKWILERKLMQPAEELQSGTWFKEEWTKWQKALQSWRKVQAEWKDPVKKKALIARKKAELAKKKESSGADGEKEKDAEAPVEEEEVKLMEINAEDIDVSSVDDVTDLGNGEPLFACFAYEDWTLLAARYELHLLLHAFKKDLNDPDRPSFAEGHVAFYYNKYFKKPFQLKSFSCKEFKDFTELVKDTMDCNEETKLLDTKLAEDTEAAHFVKLAEEDRRERQRRADAGDETAALNFPRPAPGPRQPQSAPPPRGSAPQSGSRPASGGQGYQPQKRPYSGASSYPPPKQPRSYGSSSYYSRR